METSDNEDGSLETSLSSLKIRAVKCELDVVEALNRLKCVEFKMKQEIEDLSETELKSKPGLRHWLQARQMSKDCSFQEFFDCFLDEHKKEHRLDLSDRSILLNKDACKLFGIPGHNVKITMLDILERLPLLFH